MPILLARSMHGLTAARNKGDDEMTTKHTPGPWRTGDVFNTVFGPPNGEPAPQTIATVMHGDVANAKLIAAAPDMAEALRLLVSGKLFEAEKKARAALAKAHATADMNCPRCDDTDIDPRDGGDCELCQGKAAL
jgi:hypothetical protein